LATAGIYAVRHQWHRMAEDHENARRLAQGLLKRGFELAWPVETNMVWVADPRQQLFEIAAALRAEGFLISPSSPSSVRLVTHLLIEQRHVDRLLEVVDRALTTPH
jgi:threonine aldolase